jgi:hypothetical protein
MKTILVINDHSQAAHHAVACAFHIAQSQHAHIILANISAIPIPEQYMVMAGNSKQMNVQFHQGPNVKPHPHQISDQSINFTPEISELDIVGWEATQLAGFINQTAVWMIIKGKPAADSDLAIHSVLNKVGCPLLLVPETWPIKKFERMVYIADLRYCRLQVMRYLAEMARSLGSTLSVAHFSLAGLTNIVDNYAQILFDGEIRRQVDYGQLVFNNIKERNLNTAVDIIVHEMRNDLLVMVNHQFHFEEIMGSNLPRQLPPVITVPVLIFPY